MLRLRVLLQSKIFLIVSAIFLSLYILLFTKVIKYESKYTNDTYVEGIVISKKIDGDKLSLVIKNKEKIIVNYYFKSEDEKKGYEEELSLGMEVGVKGMMDNPQKNTIPNTFNYQEYLYNKKIYVLMSAAKIEIINDEVGPFYAFKNMIGKRIMKFSKTRNYMQAFILGDNGYIDNDVYRNYRSNGVTHLFAVSGMHVGFLTLFLASIFKRVKIIAKYSDIILVIFLFGYMGIVGFSPSVVRASLLYIFLMINKKMNLKLNSINVLYLVFMLLLIINPFYIYDIGFLYSFMTSFGLILFSKKIRGNYLKKTFLISLIAFIFSLPITLGNFYNFNILTVFNNIVVVPLVSVILFPLSIITFFLPFLEGALALGFALLESINSLLALISIDVVVPKINLLFIIIYYFLVYLIYKYNFKWIICLGALIIIYKNIGYLDSNSYIYFLDVGQGDASLIISERRKDIIMIDTGGKIEYEKKEWQQRDKTFSLASNIGQFLYSLGISKLNLLIITHGDTDHLGYAEEIMEVIKIERLMLNNNSLNNQEKKLFDNVKQKIKDNYLTKQLKIYNLNDLKVKDENDSSLALLVNLEKRNFLFMGDAPKRVENNILKKYSLKEIGILKLGHHGSRTSSGEEFLRVVNPRVAIISAGRNNRYNHPSMETLETLDNLKMKYFNTQINGTIMFKFRKKKEVWKFFPPI